MDKKEKINTTEYHAMKWELRFLELKKFKEIFGHCDVSLSQKTQYYALGQWCNKQRHNRKFKPLKFNPDYERRLNKIGFSWGILDKKFEEKFSQLVAFKKKYGHCNVPQHNAKYRNLNTWVHSQRIMRNHKLIKYPDRMRRLEEIGFSWIPFEELFEKRLAELVEFKSEHGHCNAPCREPFLALHKWCKRQRVSKNLNFERLSLDKEQRLNKIGFSWNPFGERFDKMYLELKKYYQITGHCRVTMTENLALAKWCARLRYLKSKRMKRLTPKRIRKLDGLKFDWVLPDTNTVLKAEEVQII